MSKSLTHDELDTAIDRVVFDGRPVSTGDENLDALTRVASGLKGLADPSFKAHLREELVGKEITIVSRVGLPFTSWFRGQRAFLVAGSSSGLMAGACCVSGATAHVLGLSSAESVSNFIHSTIPYFIGLSIAGLLGWLWWILREQGITPATIATTVRQHGLALGSGYAAVFTATMMLSMFMGLY